MSLSGRILVAIALATGSAWVTVGQAFACSCLFTTHAEAIRAADVAFIGTVVAEDEPGEVGDDPVRVATYAFEVERATEPISARFETDAFFGGDANCGFDMNVGEEWLVVGRIEDGRPLTNLCMGTARTDELDGPTLLAAEAALASLPQAAPTEPQSPWIPAGLVVMVAAVSSVAVVSLVGFRRTGAR